MKKLSIRSVIASVMVVASLAAASLAFAAAGSASSASPVPTGKHGLEFKKFTAAKKGMGGTVTAISGTTVTVAGMGKNAPTYTIDTSKARFVGTGKKKTSFSDIQIGDTISVIGIVDGNNVAARMIIVRPAGITKPKAFLSKQKTKS